MGPSIGKSLLFVGRSFGSEGNPNVKAFLMLGPSILLQRPFLGMGIGWAETEVVVVDIVVVDGPSPNVPGWDGLKRVYGLGRGSGWRPSRRSIDRTKPGPPMSPTVARGGPSSQAS